MLMGETPELPIPRGMAGPGMLADTLVKQWDDHAPLNMVGVEPWACLRDLMCLFPRWPKHQVLELAPVNWAATVAREDVQAKLAADPYRALTLGD